MQETIVSKFYIFSTPIEYEKMEKKNNMLIETLHLVDALAGTSQE